MPEPFHVRRLRPADLDRIQEIEHASFGKDAYDRNLFAEYLHKCGELFLVATRAGGSGAEVISIAVDPAARGKGAASVLLRSTFRRLRRRGIPRVSLMVKVTNVPARRFYEKWGFTRVRRVKGYYEDGKDGIRMMAEIPDLHS